MKRGRGQLWRVVLALVIVRIALAIPSPAAQLLCLVALHVLLVPWLLVRLVAVPLGLVRTAAFVGRLADDVWDGDAAGASLVAAAWAILRRGDGQGRAAFEARAQRSTHLGAGGLVGAGFLAAAAGDHDRARRLLASVDLLPRSSTPREALRLASLWRLADALARGDFAAAVELGPRLGRRGHFLGLAARRLGGGLGVVSDAELERAWFWSGRRQADRALLERALIHQAPAQPAPAQPLVVTLEDSALGSALGRHAALGLRPPLAAELVVCAAAWDAALVGAAERAGARGAALGVTDTDAVVAAMAGGVESDLADTALAAGLIVPDGTGMLGRVHRRVRGRVIGDLEAACRDLGERLAARRDLPTILEWTEVLAVRALAARAAALGGPEVRRLVFADLHGAVCPLACRLWNDRHEHALAGALFRWLFEEAKAVGDERLAEHERRNLQPGR